jgi:hypothetical protein
MPDSRVERYASLLVDTCLHVEQGWQVLVWGYPQARPLLDDLTVIGDSLVNSGPAEKPLSSGDLAQRANHAPAER